MPTSTVTVGVAMRGIVSGLLAVAVLGCSAKAITHDPKLAASAALQYGTAAFVEGDPERAYALLADETRRTVSPQKHREVVSVLHPALRPVSLTATEFEPVLGQETMQIFLHGQNGSEDFYYRLVMQGSAPTGYKVSGFYRGSGPYPASRFRAKL